MPERRVLGTLLFIWKAAQASYVVQLDADTITLGGWMRLVQCIQTNTKLHTGYEGRASNRHDEGSACAAWPSSFATATASRVRRADRHRGSIDQLPGYAHLKYVRGSAGFAGYGMKSYERETLEDFADAMERAIGTEKLREWGGDQVASNFSSPTLPSACVFPFPKYATTTRAIRRRVVLHSLHGTYRFRKGVYRRLCRAFLREASPAASTGDADG